MFTSVRGGYMSTGATARRLAEARGQDMEWVTSHVFRKTVATLINAEHDAEATARQLGQSRKATTLRHCIAGPNERRAPDLTAVLEQLA